MIYADCAAQRPPLKAAVEAAAYAIGCWGNPSGVHEQAAGAAKLIFEARKTVAEILGAQASEIIFTASGTESNNMAVFSAAQWGAENNRRKLLIFTAEHSSVLAAAQQAERLFGCRAELIPCGADGRVDIDALRGMADGETALISLMHANNETGIIQPVREAADIAKKVGALFHTDAVQTAGHIPVDVKALGCDMLSLSAHKFGGIVGAGALYCRAGVKITPLICGGGQERGRRSGTQAVPAIYAMGAALREEAENMAENTARTAALRDSLQAQLGGIEGIVTVGAESERVPGTLCVCLPDNDGEKLALLLNREGICVSSGAACTTGSDAASHVLTAMGIDSRTAKGALRFSLCHENMQEEIDAIAAALKGIIARG